MENNCFVFELMADVNNDNLPIFGKILMENKLDVPALVVITPSTGSFVLTVKDGYFTNQTGTDNYGTTANVTAGSTTYRRYVTAGSKLYVDKYDLEHVETGLCFNIGELHSENNLDFIVADNGKGDAAKIVSTILKRISLRNSNYYGDIRTLIANNQSTLENVAINNSNITFDNLDGMNFTKGLKIDQQPTTINGFDLSKAENVIYYQVTHTGIEQRHLYTWSKISNGSTWINALNYVHFAGSQDIDNMLICQADGKTINSKNTATWEKTINVFGGVDGNISRTSASDAAVATLKGLGLTIKVNGVTQ